MILISLTSQRYFRQKYYSACDILIQELVDSFEQKDFMQPVLAMESLLIKSANQNGVGRGFAGSWFRMPREFLPDSCWTDMYSWPCGQSLPWFSQTTSGWACQYSRSKPFRSTLYRSPCPSTPPTSCMAKPSLPTAASKAHSPSEGVEVDPKGLQGTRRYEASYNSGGCGQQE